MNKGYFITGTDTGVGKTFVTCALIRALQGKGKQVAAMKPVAAGTVAKHGMNEDVHAFMELTHAQHALRDVNPYCFAEPIAPHIAAVHEGAKVDLAEIRAAFGRLQAASDFVLVEGAGGFLVPLNASRSLSDLPGELGLDVILVVGMRLGCLNHALLTVEAVKARGLKLAGWIANTPGEKMNAFEENLATLKFMIPSPCLGNISYVKKTKVSNAAISLDIDTLIAQP